MRLPGKNIHTVYRSIYNYKMDYNQRINSGERYAKRRPEELIEKYIKEISSCKLIVTLKTIHEYNFNANVPRIVYKIL